MSRLLAAAFISLVVVAVAGCHGRGFGAKPRTRRGSYASSTMGTNFLDPEDLGQHGYAGSWSEKNGIVYTCKAGHIDIAHVRKAADWTAFLAARTSKHLMKDETKFSFRLKEPSRHFVHVTYPDNWKGLPSSDKELIARDISVRLGQYFAYTATTWHEIITWFGYKGAGIVPEFNSAFSWEDTFSNLLGCHLAALALQDTEHTFDEAMTLALDAELKKLGAQPAHIARRAAEKVRGQWFSGDLLLFVEVRGRNLDIGLTDGFVTPWIVPSLGECEGAEPQPYPVPNFDLSEYGFSVKLEIEPREWEKDKILKIAYPDSKKRKKRVEPIRHFALIMDYIRKDAVKKYGPDVRVRSDAR